MSTLVYLNGRLVEANEAAVSASNPSLLHGAGLFETLRTYDRKPFRLEQHLERMEKSAIRLNLSLGDAPGRVAEAIQEVLAANNLHEARVRFTITPPAAGDAEAATTLLVAAQEVGYPPALYQTGMSVCVCNYRQSRHDPLAGHKTTSYFPRLLGLRDAHDRGCGEALWFTPENLLAEGCISNVFVARDGKLRTPALNTPVLPGVTRAAVIEAARAQGITVEEADLTINDLLDADEVFLTNSVMEIMPVVRVERKGIGNEKVGDLTRRVADAYRALVQEETA